MSSGFVSGGTTEQPIERDQEWLRAQQELEASRRLKQEQSRQQDGKTLYEVLQANKGNCARQPHPTAAHYCHDCGNRVAEEYWTD